MILALSSFATGDLEICQSGSSQVRPAFAGRCDSALVVAKDTFIVSAMEDIAQSSQVFENLATLLQGLSFLPSRHPLLILCLLLLGSLLRQKE
jgi:hypothetical protein